jgi:acyl carrier protein
VYFIRTGDSRRNGRLRTPVSDLPDPVSEARLASMWCEILKVDAVNPDDNFFRLGGDSLKAAGLMAQIDEVFGLQIDPVDLFENPTFANFVAVVFAQRRA